MTWVYKIAHDIKRRVGFLNNIAYEIRTTIKCHYFKKTEYIGVT